MLGLPDNTAISQAAMDMDAGGLAQIIFYDPAVEPASGELGRNGSTLKFRIEDARTATTIRPFAVAATTTGAPAASIGVGMLWQAESGDEVPSDFGALDFVASDVGAGTEDTYASLLLRVAGRALDEKYRFSSTAGDGFAALFAHANTADRIYTLPDRDAALGGRVLQVVTATYATQTSVSSNTHTDTGLTATITPSSTSSTILVMVTQNGLRKDTNDTGVSMALQRGGADIVSDWLVSAGSDGTATGRMHPSASLNYVDSPASTSALVYKTQFWSSGNNASVSVQFNSSRSTMVLMEIAG